MNSQNSPTPDTDQDKSAVIKVFGVGGGGCNALEQMISAEIRGVEFKCINTDAQALEKYAPENTIELGTELTKGLGAGANPEVGCAAAEESADDIAAAIGNADMLFLTAGMGGGTGTGAVPVVAKIARELGVLTVAVVTEPFAFEGDKRRKVAEAGLEELRNNADSMIVVPNENLMTFLGPDVTLIEAFAAANDVVTNAVQSIAELITASGLINVDFADVKTVMTEMGHAIMSTGTGIGENRAEEAAVSAIESPLLNNVDLKAAKGILANITSSSDLSMGEFQIVGDIIRTIAADDATVVVGTVFDDQMGHEMKVTVVATGLQPPKNKPAAKKNNSVSSRLTQASPEVAGESAADGSAEATVVADSSLPPITPQFELAAAPANEPVAAMQTPKAAAAISAAPDVETCVVCGGTQGAHKEKCPWAKGSIALPVESAAPPSAPMASRTEEPVAVKDSGKVKSGKGKVMGASVAAAVALVSALYFFIGKGSGDPAESAVVEQQEEDGRDRMRYALPHKIPNLQKNTDVTNFDDE